MPRKNRIYPSIFASFAIFLIVLDTKTAIHAARDAIEICINTVIPSLFPLFVLSGIIVNNLRQSSFSGRKVITKMLKIPSGSESLLLIGLIGGYPIGAQVVTQAYHEEKISLSAAKRMIPFCNNAGPAFIFGMASSLFASGLIPWVIWSIQIVSAILVAIFLPALHHDNGFLFPAKKTNQASVLERAIKNMATVCAWIVLFRIIIDFITRWFIFCLPPNLQILLSGIFELSNGCFLLSNIPNESTRFLFISFMLSFGGICVTLQTLSITKNFSIKYYLYGKLLHCQITLILVHVLQPILFMNRKMDLPIFLFQVVALFISVFIPKTHINTLAFQQKMLYNSQKQ